MIPCGEQAQGRGRAASLELQLQRGREAPAVARAATNGLCEKVALSGSRCQTLLLLVSETVTNAVLHSDAPASSAIAFVVSADDQRVRVEVADGGSGFDVPAISPDGGWGLRLLDSEATRWGVDSARGTCVWFELERGSC